MNQLVNEENKRATKVALLVIIIVNLMSQIHHFIMQELESVNISVLNGILIKVNLSALESWRPLQSLVDPSAIQKVTKLVLIFLFILGVIISLWDVCLKFLLLFIIFIRICSKEVFEHKLIGIRIWLAHLDILDLLFPFLMHFMPLLDHTAVVSDDLSCSSLSDGLSAGFALFRSQVHEVEPLSFMLAES